MDKETLFDIFKIAIVNEHKTYEFYEKAAREATQTEAKSLFQRFAAVELKHERELEELYKTLRQ